MMFVILLSFLWLSHIHAQNAVSILPLRKIYPIASTSNGLILGKYIETNDTKSGYSAFRSIPYAEPPLGDLRFQAPKPIKNWKGILNGTQEPNICVQSDGQEVIGSEDCLYLNVYTPNFQSKIKTIPVIVWIHGGGFNLGSSRANPEFFMKERVVFVSLNYRLGIFGFLSTQDQVASGNYGLKDQLLALKWVKKNIRNFGGDPNNVAIIGESAGAASVSYLTQMPAAKGLFHKVISLSGVSLCSWSLARRMRTVIQTVAGILLTNTSLASSKTILDGLKKVNFVDLQKAAVVASFTDEIITNPATLFGFAPVIEPDVEGAVFTNKSYVLVSNGDFQRIPQIIGFSSFEGVALIPVLDSFRSYVARYDVWPNKLVPVDMNVKNESLEIVTAKIKEHYFGTKLISESPEEFAKYLSDIFFVLPVYETVRLMSRFSPVYYYQFSYMGKLGTADRKHPGVGHSEIINYMFKSEKDGTPVDEADDSIRRQLVKFWTNFAKYSMPTPFDKNNPWDAANVNKTGLKYLNIDRNLTMEYNPHWNDVSFWKNLYDTFGNPPYDTY